MTNEMQQEAPSAKSVVFFVAFFRDPETIIFVGRPFFININKLTRPTN